MESNYQQFRVRDVGNFYSGSWPDGRKLTKVSWVEFSSADVRREFLEATKLKKAQCTIGGKSLEIKRAKTELAIQRDSFLRKAADALKSDSRCKGCKVEIEFTNQANRVRGVQVDGVYAYNQGKSDLGKFLAPYDDLELAHGFNS